MSIMYFLICRKHKNSVYITDNKGSSADAKAVREFLYNHKIGEENCHIELVSEYELQNLEYGDNDWKNYYLDDDDEVRKDD